MKNILLVLVLILIVLCSYLWYRVYKLDNPTSTQDTTSTQEVQKESDFDKQNKCKSYYNQYKDYTNQFIYKSDSAEQIVEELSVSYSHELDTCIAAWLTNFSYWNIGDNDHFTEYTFYIVDALKWNTPIMECTRDIFKQDDECSLTLWRNKVRLLSR